MSACLALYEQLEGVGIPSEMNSHLDVAFVIVVLFCLGVVFVFWYKGLDSVWASGEGTQAYGVKATAVYPARQTLGLPRPQSGPPSLCPQL